MPNIKLAGEMFAALKRDWKIAWDAKQKYVGDIYLDNYKEKFGVVSEDVKAYCATLTPLAPVHPKCVVCGMDWFDWREDVERYEDIEWHAAMRTIEPVGDGVRINWVDSFETFCCGKDLGRGKSSHDTIWYHQFGSDIDYCSFNYQVENLHGYEFEVRWNCSCMMRNCHRENAIYLVEEKYGHSDLKLLKEFDYLPYTISRDDIYKKVEPLLLLM